MKKIIIFVVAIATLFAFSSCQKEGLRGNGSVNGLRVITAEFENNGTKTTLDADGITPEWAEGDVLRLLNSSSCQDVKIISGSGTPESGKAYIDGSGLKIGTTLTGTLYAVYPASATTMESCDGNITFTIPATQVGTFASANICVAKSSEEDQTKKDNLIFRNATAVLQIKTPADVIEVEVVAANNIAGPVTATFSGSEVTLNTDSLDNTTVSVSGMTVPPDNIFYLAAAPVTTGEVNVTCSTINKMGTSEKGSKPLEKNVIYSMNLSDMELPDPACVAAGTMVTMGDGSQKAVEKLEVGDVVRTVDHKTGQVSSAPVCFVWETKNVANVFTLTFGNDTDVTEVTVVQEHGFYDKEERKYAFINANNAKDYFGHHFFNADNGQWLELKSCRILNKRVDAYSVVTSKHLNHLADGMLSMCDGEEEILSNIFEYDDHLKFDEAKKAADIAKYGLTPLEKILEYKGFTEDFYYDYNLMYLNVAVGKGLISWDYVQALSDYYESYQID